MFRLSRSALKVSLGGGWSNKVLCHSQLDLRLSWAVKITVFREKEMRGKAKKNELMRYLNVDMIGLRGRNHPCISKSSGSSV